MNDQRAFNYCLDLFGFYYWYWYKVFGHLYVRDFPDFFEVAEKYFYFG